MEADPGTVAPKNPVKVLSRWEIPLRAWPRRIAAVVIAVALAAAVETHVWGKCVAAWITRGAPPDIAVYEEAIRQDPENAAYHFRLAQLYNTTERLDVARAREEFEKAVALNPLRTNYWLELSKFHENEGDADPAREAMRKALENDPQDARTHWAAANLHIRQNDLPAADSEVRQTVERDSAYMAQALDLAWRFYEDPDRIVATHIPNTKATNLTALNYFIARTSDRGASLAWSRLETFDTTIQERFPYIDYLVGRSHSAEAWRVFQFPMKEPAFFNGSFESEILNGGFDWRIASSDDASVRRDSASAKDGLACLSVTFSGKENIDYGGQVWHWIPVQQGKSYALSFWMKTDDITTNEGMYIEVDGQVSEKQVGTTYWQQFTIPFKASADLVVARLRRAPSQKFDNLLKGKVWLDGFNLAEIL